MADEYTRRTVRDSFSIPVSDHELIEQLQQRALSGKVSASKSELVRAGLHALNRMNEQRFLTILGGLEKVKPGRPPGRGK